MRLPQLVRNHGEVVVKEKGVSNLVNLAGFNFRMAETEAAIASERIKKLETMLVPQIGAAEFLTQELKRFPGIRTPAVCLGVSHCHHMYVIRCDASMLRVPHNGFVEALKAESIPALAGFVEPLYLESLYQGRIAFAKDRFPFSSPGYTGSVNYQSCICSVTERMQFKKVTNTTFCHAKKTPADLRDWPTAFDKVMNHLDKLAT